MTKKKHRKKQKDFHKGFLYLSHAFIVSEIGKPSQISKLSYQPKSRY